MAVMVKWFLLAMILLLAAEVAAVLAVGAILGLPRTLLLLVATSFIGVAVLRHPGPARIARLHEAVAKEGIAGLEAGGDAFMTIAAGILLLIPGFITDAAGLLLLLPPVRHWIGRRFRHHLRTGPAGSPGVVDLERGQWSQVPDQQIDDKRRPSNPS